MVENNPINPQEPELVLPFHPHTLLLGLLRRWPIVAGCLFVAGVLGVVGALMWGSRTWEAETILLYQPTIIAGPKKRGYTTPPLSTQVSLVKMRSNLAEVRRRLRVPARLTTLGAACRVSVQRGTNLMTIRVKWSSAKTAADIADTLREVFLENQKFIRKAEAAKQIEDLEARLAAVQRQLQIADTALQEFTISKNVIDVQRETQGYLDEITSLDILLEQTKIDKQTLERQLASLNQLTKDLERRVAKEQGMGLESGNLGDLNTRIARLRESIRADREYRAKNAELAQREAELERAGRLKEQGIISVAEYERKRADYERQKAITVDTDQIKQWKGELEQLERMATLSQSRVTPSTPLLQETKSKVFDLQLQQVALENKLEHLEKLREKFQSKLDSLPVLQREYVTLSRDVAARVAEKENVEESLTKARHVFESEVSDFTVVSEAKVPTIPSKSNRRPIFIAIVALGGITGFGLVLLLELLDTTIKSASELSLKLSLPVLGGVPRPSPGGSLFPARKRAHRATAATKVNQSHRPSSASVRWLKPWQGMLVEGDTVLKSLPLTLQESTPESAEAFETTFVEPFRIMARRLRTGVRKQGARILIASAQHDEGKTMVAAGLAACLGRQDERVLLVDAQIRSAEDQGIRAVTQHGPGKVESILLEPIKSLTQRFASHADGDGPAAKLAAWWERQKQGRGGRDLGPASAGERYTLQDLIPASATTLQGLGEYLSYHTDQPEDVVWPTILPGVACLPRIGAAVIPDLLGSNRMHELLEALSERYSLILIDVSPVLPYVDTELLAQWSDAILLVVRSGRCRTATLRKAVDRLKVTGVPIVGVILTDVDPLYLENA